MSYLGGCLVNLGVGGRQLLLYFRQFHVFIAQRRSALTSLMCQPPITHHFHRQSIYDVTGQLSEGTFVRIRSSSAVRHSQGPP